ncbi:TIGR03936 family radical SAM-associated protein [Nocardioides sp. Kera G14]|uniref:TIGR03936 family radical SAM-associated protein n=1 Tax=Nocardioides sp. Kera G14 TaxID=2884264 RepID=UPI001D118DF1|nr:TIGR03936 family radical SAM-associated protein [Nocardioides sp. Kera G14]UDY24506.1 TIGR03936 family radical SAM-associated protein [Nocardioides sp. Kera G14]
MAREIPEQQAPPVQRLRIRYAKRGRLRFTSHRDFSRAFERALMRTKIPMAYSSGFNPHPRVSYAGASPTGAASEAEYVEIGLAQVVDPAHVKALLVGALPVGLDIEEVVESPGGSLADLMQASSWHIDVPVPPIQAAAAVEVFLKADEVPVERMTKKGMRSFDARAAVVSMSVESLGEGVRISLVLKHGTPAVRPDDVMSGLASLGGLQVGAEYGGLPLLTRLTQGPFDESTGAISDPFSSQPAL